MLWQRSLCHLHHWKCPLESKGGGSLTSHAPSPSVPSVRIQTCHSPPTTQCSLSQTDELSSSTSKVLRVSPKHSLNFSKPCQRPGSKMQKNELVLEQRTEAKSAAARKFLRLTKTMQPQYVQWFPLNSLFFKWGKDPNNKHNKTKARQLFMI